MRTFILIFSLFSGLIVHSQENSDLGKFMKKLMIETDIGYFKAFAPSEIQDMMEEQGLYLSGGGGWFSDPWRSYPRVYDESVFMLSIMLGYELKNHYEAGLFYNSGDKAEVLGDYKGKYELRATCEDFMLGAYFRYHISTFEFHAGPCFQFVTTQTGEIDKMGINRQTLPGISGGINLEIPQRPSRFDFIIGYKYNYFFSNIDVDHYDLSATGTNGDMINYTLPALEANANSYFIHVGFRVNIRNFEKNIR
jgi:hypothetical protein